MPYQNGKRTRRESASTSDIQSVIFFYQAVDFAAAADACAVTYGRYAPSRLMRFLLARSFELAAKSGLCAKGVPLAAIRRRPFGHDLAQLLRESDRRGLLMVDTWTSEVTWGIERLSEAYASKDLEYAESDSLTGPTPFVLRELLHHALYRAALFALSPEARERLLTQDPPRPGFSVQMLDQYRTWAE